jgi:hypothetical protein
MVLSYDWPADRESVTWSLVSSSLLKSLDGAYRLSPKGSGTDVTYELSVDLIIPMIGCSSARPSAADRHRIEGPQETSRG